MSDVTGADDLTPAVRLRRVEDGDVDVFFEHQSDPLAVEMAGNIGCWPDDGQYFLGYWIGRVWWGRGVATQALDLLLEEVPVRPLHAHVAAHNTGSIRVLEKCGFRRDRAQEATTPASDDGVEELVFVLEAKADRLAE